MTGADGYGQDSWLSKVQIISREECECTKGLLNMSDQIRHIIFFEEINRKKLTSVTLKTVDCQVGFEVCKQGI